MYIFLLVIHILAATLLVIVILIQRGRGWGLVESFAGVESMFGTKTSQFLTRATAVVATIFLFTSISLAFLAARQSRSLIDEKEISSLQEKAVEEQPTAEVEQLVDPEQPIEVEQPVEEEQLTEEQRAAETQPADSPRSE